MLHQVCLGLQTHSKGDWKRLAAAIICLLETTGTGHHKCQQGSWWVGWQHRLALGWLSFILCLTAHLPTSALIWKVLIHLGTVKYTTFCLLKTRFFCFKPDIDISLFFTSLIYQMVKVFHLDRISKIFSTQCKQSDCTAAPCSHSIIHTAFLELWYVCIIIMFIYSPHYKPIWLSFVEHNRKYCEECW